MTQERRLALKTPGVAAEAASKLLTLADGDPQKAATGFQLLQESIFSTDLPPEIVAQAVDNYLSTGETELPTSPKQAETIVKTALDRRHQTFNRAKAVIDELTSPAGPGEQHVMAEVLVIPPQLLRQAREECYHRSKVTNPKAAKDLVELVEERKRALETATQAIVDRLGVNWEFQPPEVTADGTPVQPQAWLPALTDQGRMVRGATAGVDGRRTQVGKFDWLYLSPKDLRNLVDGIVSSGGVLPPNQRNILAIGLTGELLNDPYPQVQGLIADIFEQQQETAVNFSRSPASQRPGSSKFLRGLLGFFGLWPITPPGGIFSTNHQDIKNAAAEGRPHLFENPQQIGGVLVPSPETLATAEVVAHRGNPQLFKTVQAGIKALDQYGSIITKHPAKLAGLQQRLSELTSQFPQMLSAAVEIEPAIDEQALRTALETGRLTPQQLSQVLTIIRSQQEAARQTEMLSGRAAALTKRLKAARKQLTTAAAIELRTMNLNQVAQLGEDRAVLNILAVRGEELALRADSLRSQVGNLTTRLYKSSNWGIQLLDLAENSGQEFRRPLKPDNPDRIQSQLRQIDQWIAELSTSLDTVLPTSLNLRPNDPRVLSYIETRLNTLRAAKNPPPGLERKIRTTKNLFSKRPDDPGKTPKQWILQELTSTRRLLATLAETSRGLAAVEQEKQIIHQAVINETPPPSETLSWLLDVDPRLQGKSPAVYAQLRNLPPEVKKDPRRFTTQLEQAQDLLAKFSAIKTPKIDIPADKDEALNLIGEIKNRITENRPSPSADNSDRLFQSSSRKMEEFLKDFETAIRDGNPFLAAGSRKTPIQALIAATKFRVATTAAMIGVPEWEKEREEIDRQLAEIQIEKLEATAARQAYQLVTAATQITAELEGAEANFLSAMGRLGLTLDPDFFKTL